MGRFAESVHLLLLAACGIVWLAIFLALPVVLDESSCVPGAGQGSDGNWELALERIEDLGGVVPHGALGTRRRATV